MNRRLSFAACVLFALGCYCVPAAAAETATAGVAAPSAVAPSAAALPAAATVKGPVPSPAVQAPAVAKSVASAPLRCIPFGVRPQDEIWAVSTRGIGCVGCGSPAVNFHVLRFVRGRWLNSTAQALYATDDPSVITVFYMHGNRIEYQGSLSDGLDTYFQLVGRLSDPRPVRFIVWSWPSDRIRGILNDARTKAARTDEEGYYFAKFMAGMSGDVEVGLVGYSLGARIITGGLHLLGGGSLCGRYVPDANPHPSPLPGGEGGKNRPTMRVALWAAALHNDWLVPGHFHGQALPQADRWYIAINGCDPVLARYHMLEKCSNPVALGYAGMWGTNLLAPSIRARFEQQYVSNIIGKTHDRRPYLYSPYIAARTRETILWQSGAAASMKKSAELAAAK